jgi:hypothetical protein
MNDVIDMNDMNDNEDNKYGDSDFLARRDLTVGDFRQSEKENKRKIVEKMLALRHNMKYNKHLLSVYMKAKGLFDTMVEEHRSQLHYLDEIYRHINELIRENLSTSSKKPSAMIPELVKDKKRIGTLLKRMRASYEKLTNVDTVVGVTIDKINEISFMEDAEAADEDADDSEGGEEDDEYDDPEAVADDEEDDEDDDDEEDDEDDDDEEDDEDDDDEEDDEDDDDEEDDEDEDDDDDDDDEEEEEEEEEEEDEEEEEEDDEEDDEEEEEEEEEDDDESEDDDEDESESDNEVILLY